jgi:predicted transposase/invertase (TIGR01784 family)
MLFEEWDMDTALKVREEEGEARGEARERKRMARALQAEGMDVDTIAKITGLTVDDVLRL